MREISSSGSAEGVMGNCDPYSDSPEPVVVKQPKFTRVGEPTLLCNQVGISTHAVALATACLKLERIGWVRKSSEFLVR